MILVFLSEKDIFVLVKSILVLVRDLVSDLVLLHVSDLVPHLVSDHVHLLVSDHVLHLVSVLVLLQEQLLVSKPEILPLLEVDHVKIHVLKVQNAEFVIDVLANVVRFVKITLANVV